MDLINVFTSGEHDGLAVILIGALLLPAGYVTTKVMDWLDKR